MILKASQRGGGMQLARHLLKAENEQVEVHEIRGFVSGNLPGAMKEAQAVAMGTRCRQNLFSVSLNPPEKENVPVEAFEAAIERIEAANGLGGQPRMIVFHEKEGRRHCHAVWSRIDPETMTARPLPFFKTKLRDISKELYLEHGWRMPRGLMDSKERDPRNFDLAEWQQAKRASRDPRQLKETVQECWAVSDSQASFEKALEVRGLYLARGDRRGHVAVTYEGEAVSIARMTGTRAKEVTARVGKPDALRSVEETRAYVAAIVTPAVQGLMKEMKQAYAKALAPLHVKREAMKAQHSLERQQMDEGQRARSLAEARNRAGRLRSGVAGLWDRLTGRYGKVRAQNEAEALYCFRRDRAQRNELVADQLKERQGLQQDIRGVRRDHAAKLLELHRDLARQRDGLRVSREETSQSFERVSLRRTAPARGQVRGCGRPLELGLG